MNASDLKREFTYRQLLNTNSKLRSKINYINLQYSTMKKEQEQIINNEVKIRTKTLEKQLKTQKKEFQDQLKEKDEIIQKLQEEIARMQSKMDNDSTNSGLPTSKTAIGKPKLISNTREESDKPIGGQEGHEKHKLEGFSEEEATEIVEVSAEECPNCGSENLEVLEESVQKCEVDYEVKVIKRIYKFMEVRCKDCGHVFRTRIPDNLKEENQYGKTVQALAVCLTNEIYTPFNKTVKLISGITHGEINLCEGYVAKLQKRASKNLGSFMKELKEYIPKQEVYGWDDGVICIHTKDGILRTYCTDNVVLFTAHEHKDEDSLDEDGILLGTSERTIVMHDHILHNYNDKYFFQNVECVIHLIRRLNKMTNNAKHEWCDKLKELLSKTNKDRNKLIGDKKESFDEEYLKKLEQSYDEIIQLGYKQNKEDSNNYFIKEELNFLKDLEKYKSNYLLWAHNFKLPSTNNNSERNIRPIKSKLKISGQFQNISYAEYYATNRSYIETCKKNGINIIDACERLMSGNPYTLEEILEHGKTLQKNDQ